MDHALSKRLLWEIRWRSAHSGWPLWLGVLLLAGALGCHLLLTLPAQHQAVAADAEAQRILAEADRLRAQRPQNVSEDRLAEFQRKLPASDALPAWLEALSKSADANGIPFNQGDYRYVLEKDARHGRYLVDLSLQGSYPALRGFLAETLNTMPFTAVEELNIARADIANESVEAQLRLALYFARSTEVRP